MPELHPSSPAEPVRRQPLRSAAPLLKKYSVLMKAVTRDTSLRQRHQPEIDSVLRDIERWIAEAKAAVDISSGDLGWDDPTVDSTQTVKERLALEAMCDHLMEKGALVPLAKKYVVSLSRPCPEGRKGRCSNTFQEANTRREIVSPSESGSLIMDAIDSPRRVTAHRIHNRPRHATHLAGVAR